MPAIQRREQSAAAGARSGDELPPPALAPSRRRALTVKPP